MKRETRDELIKLAAEIVCAEEFISPFTEDNPTSTPRSVLRAAEIQQKRLKDWAYRIRIVLESEEGGTFE